MTARPVIAVVGPCASGKSTLVAALRERDFTTHHVAQEHSYVPDMWQQVVQPDLLVYLDVSFRVARRRRPTLQQEEWHAVQGRRLSHARAHCHLYIDTDPLTPRQILGRVLSFLHTEWGVR